MGYSIKTMAEKCGLSEHTLRYYEKEGIIPYVQRDENGNRSFTDEDLDRIGLICCLRDTGMSISDIRTFIALSKDGDETIPARKKILTEQRKNIQEKIKLFRKYAHKLDHKIAYYASLEDEIRKHA